MDLAYLAIMLMLMEYSLFAGFVALARVRYKVPAPAIAGHPDFERRFRVQQNTLEQLIVTIPSLWIFAVTLSPLWAALFGLVFILGRAWYAWGYYRSAPGRHWGFTAGAWGTGLLAAGAFLGIFKDLYFLIVNG
ncbi:MAG TPA: MAPEG family protein [Gammaproteobacteria bacterium]